MRTKALVFPCLSCGRDTDCVNRLVCAACRRGVVSARLRSSSLAVKKAERNSKFIKADSHLQHDHSKT